jgi:hypothetical protein
MWPKTFDQRLSAWYSLRQTVSNLPIEICLAKINQWWFGCPWRPYYLHWDDRQAWPDPWQLLSDNIYCDLAKGLGMLYTVTMLERQDISDARLVLADSGHNLVLIQNTKYILNWEQESVVNNNLTIKTIKQYQQSEVAQQYN